MLAYDSFSAWPRTARWAVQISLPTAASYYKVKGATAVQPHEVREAPGALKPPTLCWLSTCRASNLLQHQHQNRNSAPGASWHGFHGPACPVGVRCRRPCALSLFTSSGENREKTPVTQLHKHTAAAPVSPSWWHYWYWPWGRCDSSLRTASGGAGGEMFVLRTACWFRSNIWHSGRIMDSEWLPQIIK